MPAARLSFPVVLRPRGDDADKVAASTDVLFDADRKAFHRKKDGKVVEHHKAHDDDKSTIVRLRRNADQILWFADRAFRVTKVETHPGHVEVNPFVKDLPFKSNEWNYIDSGPLKDTADKGRYKVTFEFGEGGPPLDPDFECI